MDSTRGAILAFMLILVIGFVYLMLTRYADTDCTVTDYCKIDLEAIKNIPCSSDLDCKTIAWTCNQTSLTCVSPDPLFSNKFVTPGTKQDCEAVKGIWTNFTSCKNQSK